MQRSLRCFLDQDYEGPSTLLIYNNGEPYELGELDLPANKKVILINNQIDQVSKKPYASLGAINRDALDAAPPSDLVVIWDDDNIQTPNHFSEGVKGYLRAKSKSPNYKAYKPYYFYFRYDNGMEKSHNVAEPTIFVEYSHIKEIGFAQTAVSFHLQWLGALLRAGQFYEEKDGPATLICEWHSDLKVHHISGGKDSQENFNTHRKESKDTGSGEKLVPLQDNQPYYNLVNGM